MSTKQKRRRFTADQKAATVRRHLADKVPVSDICDELKIQPSVFYEWQRQVFEGLDGFFEQARGGKRAQASRDRELERHQEKIATLEAKVARKDEIIADTDISEVHLNLKKVLGKLEGPLDPPRHQGCRGRLPHRLGRANRAFVAATAGLGGRPRGQVL